MQDLDKQIEAILFYKNEPMTVQGLSKLTGKGVSEVEEALNVLEESMSGRGVILMRKDNQVRVATNPDHGATIEALIKEELSKDLGKAGLETLAIVLYKGPIARSGIDYIRGVNSAFILRNLLVRGLVERLTDQSDKRAYLYRATFDLLSHLGVAKVEDLPDFAKVKEEIEAFEKKVEEESGEEIDSNKEKEDVDA